MTDEGKNLLGCIGDVARILCLEDGQTLVVRSVLQGNFLLTSVFGPASIQKKWAKLALGAEDHFMIADAKYGQIDADSGMVLKHWGDHTPPCNVLEVGANEEDLAAIFAEQGHNVTGIDLRPWGTTFKNYTRMEGDFVALAPLLQPDFDVAVSTSAIEHFGLNVYGSPVVEDYDAQAMAAMYRLLKPGGTCYITVPYGSTFLDDGGHWRVYNRETLQQRIIGEFAIEEKIFFKSGGCVVPDVDGIVAESDADAWSGDPPHVTVFLRMRKA